MSEFTPMGSLCLLNESGDITLEWSEEHEASMRELIDKKIKEGYSFFVVKKVFGFNRNVKVRDISQVKVGAKLLLRDEDALRLFSEGRVQVRRTDNSRLEAGERVTDPEVILKNDTIAVRPIAAG